MRARIDRTGLREHQEHAHVGVFIIWDDRDTDVVDNLTGCVLYSRPTTHRALENAVAWVRVQRLTLTRVDITPRVEPQLFKPTKALVPMDTALTSMFVNASRMLAAGLNQLNAYADRLEAMKS